MVHDRCVDDGQTFLEKVLKSFELFLSSQTSYNMNPHEDTKTRVEHISEEWRSTSSWSGWGPFGGVVHLQGIKKPQPRLEYFTTVFHFHFKNPLFLSPTQKLRLLSDRLLLTKHFQSWVTFWLLCLLSKCWVSLISQWAECVFTFVCTAPLETFSRIMISCWGMISLL